MRGRGGCLRFAFRASLRQPPPPRPLFYPPARRQPLFRRHPKALHLPCARASPAPFRAPFAPSPAVLGFGAFPRTDALTLLLPALLGHCGNNDGRLPALGRGSRFSASPWLPCFRCLSRGLRLRSLMAPRVACGSLTASRLRLPTLSPRVAFACLRCLSRALRLLTLPLACHSPAYAACLSRALWLSHGLTASPAYAFPSRGLRRPTLPLACPSRGLRLFVPCCSLSRSP